MAFLLSRMNKSYHRTFYVAYIVGGNTVSNLIPTPENCPLGTNNIELSLVKLGNLHASHSLNSFTFFSYIDGVAC